MSSSERFDAAVRMMTPPGRPDCSRKRWTMRAQPPALVARFDLARHADVIDRRHVDQEPAGQAQVGRDARALGAERLLDDLDDDFLPFLQQVFDLGRRRLALGRARDLAAGRAAIAASPRRGARLGRRGRARRDGLDGVGASARSDRLDGVVGLDVGSSDAGRRPIGVDRRRAAAHGAGTISSSSSRASSVGLMTSVT